ncbi:MAG: hypothetical protein ACI9N1_001134 [Flavobacteriales bacterium]|jgi:hypothetical protein
MKIISTQNLRNVFIISIVSFFLLIGELQAQEVSKPRIDIPNHKISFGILGETPLSLHFEFRLSNKLLLEVGCGSGYSGGIKYVITNPMKHRLSVFTGIKFTSTQAKEYTDSSGNTGKSFVFNGNSLYVPIGVSYLGKRNFQYSLEAATLISKNFITPYAGLKVGYRFSVDYEKIKTSKKTSKRNILSGSFFGMTPLIGITYERLLTPFLGIDVGIGLPSAGMGFKLYTPQIRDDKWNFHIGGSHHFFVFPWAGGWKTYFPIGLNRMSGNGFRISIDLGPQISWHENIGSNSDLSFNGNLRIGKAF